MSPDQWAGRTDSNKWVVFDKEHSKIGDSVMVKIDEAKRFIIERYFAILKFVK